MNDDYAASIARFLTNGKRVTKASLALEIGGSSADDAREFFALREMLGIMGYMDETHATLAIRGKLKA